MNARASLWASLAIAASIGLAGCGGSSDTKTNTEDDMMDDPGGQPTPAALPTGSLDLPTGHNLTVPDQGTETEFTVPANGMRTLGNVTFECKSSRACTVTVRNLLGQPDATRVGDVEATLVAATDGGGSTTPTPGAGGTGTGSNAFLSRAMLLEAVEYDGSVFSSNEGIGSEFEAGAAVDPFTDTTYRGIVFTRETPTSDHDVHIRSDITEPTDAGTFTSLYGDLDDKTPLEVSSSDTDDFWSLIRGVGGSGSETNKQITTATYVQGEEIDSVTFGLTGGAIAGELKCESGTCVVTNMAGELSAPGVWTFEADADGSVVRPDDDYLVFGFWKQTPRGKPNARPEVLEAFYAGSDPFEADNVTGLSGRATYEGRAVGRYAHRVAATGSDPANSTNRGDFDAAVMLYADFGKATDLGTIQGFIGASDGSLAAPGNLSTGGDSTPTIGGIVLPLANISSTGTFSGGKPTGYTGGSWSGQFFGNGSEDEDEPGSAAGMFEGWKGSSSGKGEYTSLEGSFGTDHGDS